MPEPANLNTIEVAFTRGYFPRAAVFAPNGLQSTILAGSGVLLRPGGKLEVANGLNQVSSTNVGARIFAADTQRASIAGGLVGDLLPYASVVRYQNTVLFYLSQDTSAQVYLNETSVSGLTTSSTAGRLRVAVPDGVGGYNVFDAGFDKPVLTSADVTVLTAGAGTFGQRTLTGQVGVAVAPWRSKTNAIGPPSEIVYNNISPTGSTLIRIDPPNAVSGQDGWIFCGTRSADQGGGIRVVRYVYLTPRGTFTATNGSPSLTLGVGTFWTRDLRRGDQVTIDGGAYEIGDFVAETSCTLTSNFTGTTGAGKTMTLNTMAANWYDTELGALISRSVQRPRRAAGLAKYADRLFLWGIPDTVTASPTDVTGNALGAMLDDNPEHLGDLFIGTASGSNLVNVLASDGPLYLMTTTGLELLNFTNDPQKPYNLRIIAEPGFAAATNGVLYVDYFYFYNNRPGRTRAEENIDVEFARDVLKEMENWNPARVVLAVDPKNSAVLFIHDDGEATTVIPWMAQENVWGAPLNFSARIIDAQVVNGTLYVTYLSGGNYRVNEWEGGAGIGGSPYAVCQYIDGRQLNRNRLKSFVANGKIDSLDVFAVLPDTPIPDVTNAGQAAANFPLSDTAEQSEAEQFTNIEARGFAFRFNFSNGGDFQSFVARGTPRTERR